MAAITDVLIRGQYAAAKAFQSLKEDMAAASEKAAQITDGFADIKGFYDLAAGAVVQGMELIQQAYDQTIAKTVEYASQVRQMSLLVGQNATETSKMIAVADRAGIAFNDLENVMEAAAEKGIDVSIDGLVKLSQQYTAIQNPIGRTQFLIETFGETGAKLGPLMAIGEQDIRDFAMAAEEAGVVLDEKAIKAAQNYEIVLDRMNDRIEAQKIKIGNELIPVLVDYMDTSLGVNEAVDKTNTGWINLIPTLAGVRDAYFAVGEIIDVIKGKAQEAEDELKEANNQMQYLVTSSTSVPVMPHSSVPRGGYKAGEGPAYTGAGIPLPGRAGGGPGVAGHTYLAGEAGPEWVTLGSNAYFTPVGTAGSGGDVTVNLSMPSTFSLADQTRAEQVLFPLIESAVRRLKRNGEI